MNHEEFVKKLDEPIPWWKELYYKLWRTQDNIRGFPREIKWFFQKQIRGYSDCDLWGLDQSLGEHIVKCLKAFRKIGKSGKPGEFTCDRDGNNISKEEGKRNWEAVLNDMIEGMEYLTNPDEGNNIYYEQYKAGKITSEEWFNKREASYKQAQEKAMLFIKYFNNLWD